AAMSHEFVLEKPQTKNFAVQRIVTVQVPRKVKKKIRVKKDVLISELPEEKRPKLPKTSDGSPLPVFVSIEEEQEHEVSELVDEKVTQTVVEEHPANVVRMADAHNDQQHHRMFTHFVVGRYVDEKFEVPEKTDGLVFGGPDYMKRGFHDMTELDELVLLRHVVEFFGWKGDYLEKPDDGDPSDDFHDSGEGE